VLDILSHQRNVPHNGGKHVTVQDSVESWVGLVFARRPEMPLHDSYFRSGFLGCQTNNRVLIGDRNVS
jgi:hypothetical protein